MPEAEPPGNVRVANEVQPQQLVEPFDRRLLDGSGGRGSELGIERVPRDGGAFENEARLAGEQGELLGERRGDSRRHVDACERGVGHCSRGSGGTVGRPRELLEVEGVAAAVLVELAWRLCRRRARGPPRA